MRINSTYFFPFIFQISFREICLEFLIIAIIIYIGPTLIKRAVVVWKGWLDIHFIVTYMENIALHILNTVVLV